MEQTFEYTVTKRQQVNYDNNFSKILNLEKYKNLLKKINFFFQIFKHSVVKQLLL